MVIRSVYLFVLCILILMVLSACSPAASTTPQAASSPGAVATNTPVPPPPQPTSATLAPRTPSPFISPTPAPRVGLPGGAPTLAGAPPTNPPVTAAAAAPTQPSTSSAGPAPTAPGIATGKRSEVKFAFLTALNMAEEAEPPELVAMRAELKKVPGFIDVSGDEMLITVGYDAGLVTVEQLMAKFAELKHPVKR